MVAAAVGLLPSCYYATLYCLCPTCHLISFHRLSSISSSCADFSSVDVELAACRNDDGMTMTDMPKSPKESIRRPYHAAQMKRPRCQDKGLATCHPPSGGLRPRRHLVSSSAAAAALLLLAGSPSLPSTCHAFTSGRPTNGARNGASLRIDQRSKGVVPLVQPFQNHPGMTSRYRRYRSSSAATTSNTQQLNLATLSTDEGQDEKKIPNDDRDLDTKGSSSGDTSIDQRQTRTTKGNDKRRPPPNKRTSLKWVVESVETCLCNEKGYQSEYSSHMEDKGTTPCDWKEQDLQLVDALWELCWGELSLNSF